MAMTAIVAYDVSSDRRRTRLAAYLQGWGHRIQESVFQLRLEADDLSAVRAHIEGSSAKPTTWFTFTPYAERALAALNSWEPP